MNNASKSIFVSIASYRDPEIRPTIRDLYAKAKFPGRVNGGICWQYRPDQDEPLTLPNYEGEVRIANVDAARSEGVCWARHEVQRLIEGEDYFVQIDSHTRFIPDWDAVLLEELSRCGSAKAVLSAAPARYTPPDQLQENPRPTVTAVKAFSKAHGFRTRGAFLSRAPEAPLRGAFICAGFLAGPAQALAEVPYDPDLYFNEEELAYSARLWTFGWDIFHPTRALVYHYYKVGKHRSERTADWQDNSNWSRISDRSRKRFFHLFGPESEAPPEALEELDRFGVGTARTVASFEEFSGIRFSPPEATERALRCQFIEGLERYLQRGALYVPELDGKPSGKGRPPKDLLAELLAASRRESDRGAPVATKSQEIIGDRQLLFVGGTGRSGTTWLQLLLDAHPEIICRGEGHLADDLFPAIARILSQHRVRVDAFNQQYFHQTPGFPLWDEADLLETLRFLLARAVTHYAGAEGVRVFGEKTPANLRQVELLQAVAPNARFLFQVRDGRDVALSTWLHQGAHTVEQIETDPRKFTQHVQRVARLWKHDLNCARAFLARYPDQAMLVKYENLHRAPEPLLKAVFEFLGVASDEAVVSSALSETAFSRITGGRERGEEISEAQFRKGVVGDWKNYEHTGLDAAFRSVAGDTLAQFGYR